MIERSSPLIVLQPEDSVGTARQAIARGDSLGPGLVARAVIPRGHKAALRDIENGAAILKFGEVIGYASEFIQAGDHVHEHNVGMRDVTLRHAFCTRAREPQLVPTEQRAAFAGFERGDGRVGTRNFVVILASVNCSATVAHAIADHFNRIGLAAFPHVDGVVALTHGGGCAINTLAEGYANLTRTIAGYADHPNVAGALIVGLGCETNHIPALLERHGLVESQRLRTLTIQEEGGTRSSIAAGIDIVGGMVVAANACRRTRQGASKLLVALECGGSDGYSGLSANPALGYATDLLVENGGTAVLAETPEIYGGEHLLTARAATPEVAAKLLERIDWWRAYAKRSGAELNNNPSFGNKAGGLTTILEKSLGAISKSGSSRLNAVYEYAERVRENGLVFMDSPGYDPIAVTGQIASGCNIVCFTTGRGSTSGYKPTPCLKLATNTPMYNRMVDDMDIDCGGIVTGIETAESVGKRIFEKILVTASGERTLSEQQGYGNNEFVPWQVGAIM
jgi:galactarate dehydratase